METIWIPLPGLDVEISSAPVLIDEFAPYAAPFQSPRRNQRGRRQLPIVGISATDASRYATWLGRQDGRVYRLPLLAELQILARTVKQEHPIWPCRPDPWDATRVTCPYEWLDCTPGYAARRPSLHCATHPMWLLNSHRQLVNAALADDDLAYVTFRLVRLR
jgi:hypothetical protein